MGSCGEIAVDLEIAEACDLEECLELGTPPAGQLRRLGGQHFARGVAIEPTGESRGGVEDDAVFARLGDADHQAVISGARDELGG
jgi:hypothetical protein